MRLEELLERSPGRLARGLDRSAGSGEGVAAEVVVLLEETLDGVHSCVGLWALAIGFGLCFFGDFASEIQVFIAPWGTRIK